MTLTLRLGLLFWLLLLSACSYRLNTQQIETDIKADIERQGRRVMLKAVTCPQGVSKQAGSYFRCVGELPTGEFFTINVIQQDDTGSVTWDIPSSKALVNLVNLEGDIEKELGKELGQRFTVDCGDVYRINNPGTSFECDIVGDVTIGSDRYESILVKINQQGNIDWQEVTVPVPGIPNVLAPAPAAATAPESNAGNQAVPTAGDASPSTASAED